MINLGIDIDGVLRNFGRQFAKYAKEQYGITVQPSDYEEWGFKTVQFDGRKIIQDVFANPEVGRYIYEEAPPLANAKTGYKMFTDNPGIQVFVVSSQKPGYEGFSDNWLEMHGFTSHIDTFYKRNKLDAPVQILIDDKPGNVEKFLINNRGALLIDHPYNRDPDLFTLKPERAGDLIDAYKMITSKYGKYI